MKKLIVLIAMLGSTAAFADGFVCKTTDNGLAIRVYNSVDPDVGVRNAAMMVLSDPYISHGRKTIARFTGVNSTLTNSGANYSAFVDLRYLDSGRKGELILGTKLGYVRSIHLDIFFSYGAPVAGGEVVRGSLEIIKRNGDTIEAALICKRYLKNG